MYNGVANKLKNTKCLTLKYRWLLKKNILKWIFKNRRLLYLLFTDNKKQNENSVCLKIFITYPNEQK